MIVTCPECSVRFTLPSDVLGPDGARVKCSGCEHIWTQAPDPEEAEPEAVTAIEDKEIVEEVQSDKEDVPIDDIPDSVKPLPEGKETSVTSDDKDADDKGGSKMLFSYGAAGGVFVLILIFLLMINGPVQKIFPSTHLLYGMFGVDAKLPGESLIFDNIVVVTHQADNNITIDGEIINLSHEKQNIPTMEMSLRDTHGKAIESWFVDLPQNKIGPQETISFKSVRDGAWDNITEVNVRFVLHKGKSDSFETASRESAPVEGHEPQTHAAPAHH